VALERMTSSQGNGEKESLEFHRVTAYLNSTMRRFNAAVLVRSELAQRRRERGAKVRNVI